MWTSISSEGGKKRLPWGNLCCSGSRAAKVTLMLLGLGGCTSLQPSPRDEKKVCLRSYIGEAEFY